MSTNFFSTFFIFYFARSIILRSLSLFCIHSFFFFSNIVVVVLVVDFYCIKITIICKKQK